MIFEFRYGVLGVMKDGAKEVRRVLSFGAQSEGSKKDTNLFTVTFDSQSGSNVSAINGIRAGSTITKPADPTLSGYSFGGWYKEAECINAWNFATSTVVSNITLYAKWIKSGEAGGGSGGGGGAVFEPEVGPNIVDPFTDVKGHWEEQYIRTVVEKGLFNGITETLFGPNEGMNRGMFVTVLGRMENVNTTNVHSAFSDVEENMYYESYIGWANQENLVNGISPTTFEPNALISREQIASILYQYAQYKKYHIAVGEDKNNLNYKDAEDISEYAVDSMKWACNAGTVYETL